MSIVQHARTVHSRRGRRLVARLFGVDGRAHELPSERDQNFCIDARGGARYVLKIANAREDEAMLAAQNAAMAHAAGSAAAWRARAWSPAATAGRSRAWRAPTVAATTSGC